MLLVGEREISEEATFPLEGTLGEWGEGGAVCAVEDHVEGL